MGGKRSSWVPWLGGLLVLAGAALMVWGALSMRSGAAPAAPATLPLPSPRPTSTPEPLIPTRTPRPVASATPSASPTPPPDAGTPTLGAGTPTVASETSTVAPETPEAATPASGADATATPTPASGATEPVAPATGTPSPPTLTPLPPTLAPLPASDFVVPPGERFRLGVSLPYGAGREYDFDALQAGWVMDWQVRAATALPPGVLYAQTVRMKGGALKPDAATLTAVAAARPGSVWLISNEPDVRWQDNVDPTTYARLYHEAYTAIKAGDPGAVVAAGGIAQTTDLRLRYLDLALAAYEAEFGARLPAQAWHIHNYMLREERNSWGVDIPPGIPDDTGVLYSIDDSGNLEAFRAQIVRFRQWMASRGYGGQPLWISEFGVPMPPDYGFPLERMAEFLRETWRFFLTASDPALGDPSDGGRLVQRWCWFSMAYPDYPTGNLLDPETGAWTPLARLWMSYVGR